MCSRGVFALWTSVSAPREPDLLVVGHRRISSEEGVRGDYLYFVHGFRDGRVCRLTAHLSRDVAVAEIEARERGRS